MTPEKGFTEGKVSSSNGLEKRPKLRFPGFDEPWRCSALSQLFDYERPDKYIVSSENYTSDGTIPVLTANQSFILGYTNETDGIYEKGEVIVFDDFTCDMKYANFPFKVKSSAIKLLTTRDSMPVYFGYNLLRHINYKPMGHARHWISVLQSYMTSIPSLSEQQKISIFLKLVDQRIDFQTKYIDALKKYKRGLLNQIFSAISKSSQTRKLRDLVHVSGGKTPSMSNSLYWNGDIVWISSKDMKSNRISDSGLKITNLALNEMTLYQPGTLLLVARSGILKHSLPLSILEVDATINQDIKALQVHGCNSFFLYYAILSQEDNIIRTHVKTGTTVQSLMMDSFLDIEIPIPNMEQQEIIIGEMNLLENYLDVHVSELSLLTQVRNGLLQQLFI